MSHSLQQIQRKMIKKIRNDIFVNNWNLFMSDY